jgi:hypothetical protein
MIDDLNEETLEFLATVCAVSKNAGDERATLKLQAMVASCFEVLHNGNAKVCVL